MKRWRQKMKRWRQKVAGGGLVVALSCLPGAAQAASEVDILLDKLVEKGLLTHVEAGLVRREIAETTETRTKEPAKEIVPGSARNWKWKGDIRLRNEYRNRTGTGTNVNRQRIRFRYGFAATVADGLKVAAQLATGGTGDPVSTNDSFDDTFTKKPITLDLAYAAYSPEIPGLGRLAVTGGVIPNPFWGPSPIVWDGDLNFDGAALNIEQDMGPATLFANSGLFSVDTDESEAASLWSAQAGVSMTPLADAEEEMAKHLKVKGAVAYHDYRNVGKAAIAGTNMVANQSKNSATLEDFDLLNSNVELSTEVGGIPAAVYADWVRNIATNAGDERDGLNLGLKVGNAKKPWSLTEGWEAGYLWQRLEADATFDEFTDSDFNGGGTNNQGHAWWANLAILKNSTVGVKYLTAHQISGSKSAEDRVQLDWVTKF